MRKIIDLPAGVTVFERGWLSANNILLCDEEQVTLIDSGYTTHQSQTLALLEQSLPVRSLDLLINTHLHSDHCGGNHALQTHYPELQTWIPPGLATAVECWHEDELSYKPTGQNCERFKFNALLEPGGVHHWAEMDWEVHAAPGHDPHSIILFAPEHRLLVSADALWENGFGVVFPELEGINAFDEVSATLDLIEQLNPAIIIPGHGAVFSDLALALSLARKKLDVFAKNPDRHASYAIKVLLKFKLLEWGSINRQEFDQWSNQVPYLNELHLRFGNGHTINAWIDMMLAELQRSGAIVVKDGVMHNT
ncbi:MBL fold metallo-hydrolase [Limnohabitans sp. DM1]|uniref:MBL fold metallo-hydrolase n=1 Tax=Limnohabitans sp. DM1 TaxID=1597955 RepID=UPI000B0BB6D2|nr:MBL fold metallo-hydrolase [Limnohabitans sp. DM1]